MSASKISKKPKANLVAMSTSKMSLKLLIDAKRNKVVFAEAGKDFVDFLLTLLALPLGTVIQLLTKSTMIGCISSLYGSLEKLDDSYLQPHQNKDSLLKPTITTQVTNPNFLLPDTKKPENRKLYYCTSHPGYVSDIHNSITMVSGVGLLNKFDIKDFGVLEEKVVEFGINEWAPSPPDLTTYHRSLLLVHA
ncbi:hypothetical protein Peur_017273 [Populus x canadensis]